MIKVIVFAFLVISAISALGREILKKPSDYVVNGKPAYKGQFPYQVSLRDYSNAHICGAILASDRWIVSAAHCTINKHAYYTFSVVGSISRTSGGHRYSTARIFNHPRFRWKTLNYDISLLLTTQPITFSHLVYPIALASSYVGPGVQAVVSGWGNTSPHGYTPAETLQYLNVTTISNDDCRRKIKQQLIRNKICEVGIMHAGPCYGDSGGPLAAGKTAIGIVSRLTKGCADGYPSIYERLSVHRNWISQTYQMI